MARKLSNRNGKTSSYEDFICQHMCNHYRRILNAKKVVDTSPPHSYKARLPAKKSSLTNRIHKPKQNRNISPAMTDRSLSTNSYKASSWGTESFISNSRYHANCIPPEPSPSSRKQALNDMKLINQITYDTKNGPAAYCDQNWTEMKSQETSKKNNNVAFDITTDKRERDTPTSKRPVSIKVSNESNEKPRFQTQRESSKVISKQTQSYISFAPKCRPRLLKTEAVSKLRSLRVYYPPRRKKKRETETSWEVSNENGLPDAQNKAFEICVCSSNQKDYKKPADAVKEQTSSRDSAYNGGVSSLPESRSPTPDHKNKIACLCGPTASIQSKAVEICNYLKGDAKDAGKEVQPSPSPQKIKLEEEEAFRKMKEDALYVKFIQDITVEVLEKGLFTNKAIKKVMRKHILNNLPKLDKNRMVKEVENLRIQLGVPEDKCLLEIEDTNEDSSSGVLKAYPTVSDSAFVLPENLEANGTDTKKIAKSISEVLQATEIMNDDSDDDADDADDFVSVIKVAKKLRERMPSADSSSEEGNSNRKKRPKVAKFSKTTAEVSRVFFSSSSESEGNMTFKRGVRKIQKCEKPWNSSCLCDEKKSRSVTFDNLEAIRQRDRKHIQMVVCSNDLQKSGRKVKAKND